MTKTPTTKKQPPSNPADTFADYFMDELPFVIDKDTKNAVRYRQVNEDGSAPFTAAVETIYIRKFVMQQGKVPQKIRVSIRIEA